MKSLRIARDLALPLDIVTQTVGVLAKRRAGKSYFLRRLVEQLFEANQQVVIADPKGDWWGIRSAADGHAPGLPIVILGGEPRRADVPLEPGAGEIVAKLVVEEQVSALLDLSLLRKHEVATFMTSFLESLYRLKASEKYRTPMMLAIDEADAIAPQRPMKGEERMLGAAEDIVRRGGQRGIGCAMATQRAAVLNKNVLTQVQVLVALRTIAPQDLAALDAWIDVHGTDEERRTLMGSLPSLPTGDAWVWSPGWPTNDGIFQRIHTLPIETFDSGATPKPGEKRQEPKQLADVDLDALKRQMAETIERAKADDPKELKKQLAEVRRELQKVQTVKPSASAPQLDASKLREMAKKEADRAVARVLRPHLAAGRRLLAAIGGTIEQLSKHRDELAAHIAQGEEIEKTGAEVTIAAPPAAQATPPRSTTAATVLRRGESESSGGLSGPEQRILDAIAWLNSIGIDEPEQTAVAFLAGYTIGGGAFNNPRGTLRTKGLVDYRPGDRIVLTSPGRERANWPTEALTSEELQRRVIERLPGPEQKILRVLLSRRGEAMDNDDLARAAGYEPGGGAFNNPRGRLRTLGLIEYPQRGQVRARSILFLE